MLTCPQCRLRHDVPGGGVTKFPRNYSYQKLLEIRTEQLVSTRQCQVNSNHLRFTKYHRSTNEYFEIRNDQLMITFIFCFFPMKYINTSIENQFDYLFFDNR